MQIEDPGSVSRRSMLKKSAVAGAVVWAAPAISTSRAFAQGSLATNQCDDCSNAQVTSVTYRYNGGGCGFAVCGPADGNNAPKCSGDTTGVTDVVVRVYKQTGNLQNGCSTSGDLLLGPVSVSQGQTFTINGGPPNLTVEIKDSTDTTVLQTLCYHFSCSQPLCFNDTHGPLTVASYTVNC